MNAQATSWPLAAAHEIAVDTSVLMAIVLREEGMEVLVRRMAQARQVMMSTASLLEARIVIQKRKANAGLDELNQLFKDFPIEMVCPDQEQIDVATEAFLIYGKGNGHKAQLNFGDLFSYALAKSRGIPLLYKGEDFALTDIVSAV